MHYDVACYMPASADIPFQIVADSLPDGWIREYYSQGLDAGDLLVERTRRSATSFHWTMGDWDLGTLTPTSSAGAITIFIAAYAAVSTSSTSGAAKTCC